ncbi:hypothetical protein P9112_003973 [Eukaryota sp. TZLM1-RC]
MLSRTLWHLVLHKTFELYCRSGCLVSNEPLLFLNKYSQISCKTKTLASLVLSKASLSFSDSVPVQTIDKITTHLQCPEISYSFESLKQDLSIDQHNLSFFGKIRSMFPHSSPLTRLYNRGSVFTNNLTNLSVHTVGKNLTIKQDTLCQFPSLKSLSIYTNIPCDSLCYIQIFALPPSVTSLYLYGQPLSTGLFGPNKFGRTLVDFHFIEFNFLEKLEMVRMEKVLGLGKFMSVKELSLFYMADFKFDFAPLFPNLTKVFVIDIEISELSLSTCSTLVDIILMCPRMLKMSLPPRCRQANLGVSGSLEEIRGLSDQKFLNDLNIQHVKKHLPYFPNYQYLKNLNLDPCDHDDLTFLPSLPSLESLFLSSVNLLKVENLDRFPRLRKLTLLETENNFFELFGPFNLIVELVLNYYSQLFNVSELFPNLQLIECSKNVFELFNSEFHKTSALILKS